MLGTQMVLKHRGTQAVNQGIVTQKAVRIGSRTLMVAEWVGSQVTATYGSRPAWQVRQERAHQGRLTGDLTGMFKTRRPVIMTT
jgi:hypothetical protein